MKTTINLDDNLLREAARITGEKEKTALVHLGLRELIHAAARKRLALLGGSKKNARAPRRKKLN